MSQKKVVLPDEMFDSSYKLLRCQREMLRSMYERGMSYKELATYYNISKSAAYYICNPIANERKVARWKKQAPKYYSTKENKKRKSELNAKSRNKVREINEHFKIAS